MDLCFKFGVKPRGVYVIRASVGPSGPGVSISCPGSGVRGPGSGVRTNHSAQLTNARVTVALPESAEFRKPDGRVHTPVKFTILLQVYYVMLYNSGRTKQPLFVRVPNTFAVNVFFHLLRK